MSEHPLNVILRLTSDEIARYDAWAGGLTEKWAQAGEDPPLGGISICFDMSSIGVTITARMGCSLVDSDGVPSLVIRDI